VPDVTVLVDDEHLAAIDKVAVALQRAGLRLRDVLPAVGAITGSVDDPQALADVAGVAAVEQAQAIQLPPPDEEVQ
jgi:hypothetical protein